MVVLRKTYVYSFVKSFCCTLIIVSVLLSGCAQNAGSVKTDREEGTQTSVSKDSKEKEVPGTDPGEILKSFETDDLNKLFDAYYEKLDGAYAEGYGSKVLQLYQKTAPEDFIKKLSVREKSRIDGIVRLLANELFIEENKERIDNVEAVYTGLVKDKGLPEKERYVCEKIIADIKSLR